MSGKMRSTTADKKKLEMELQQFYVTAGCVAAVLQQCCSSGSVAAVLHQQFYCTAAHVLLLFCCFTAASCFCEEPAKKLD